jgi:hypothetical protein
MIMFRYSLRISTLVIALLMASCVTTSTSHYGNKLTPAEVGVVVVQLDDSEDNSQLRGNHFLQEEIFAGIAGNLQEHGITAVSGAGDDFSNATHVLVLKSGGVSKNTVVRPVRTTTGQFRSGFNVHGQDTYSSPKVSGGGSYTVTNVQVTAALYSLGEDGNHAEVCRSYAKGDGQNFVEQRLRSNFVVPNKKMSDRYIRTFTDAALSVFDVK